MCQLTTAQQDLDALKEHPVVDEDGESYVVSVAYTTQHSTVAAGACHVVSQKVQHTQHYEDDSQHSQHTLVLIC